MPYSKCVENGFECGVEEKIWGASWQALEGSNHLVQIANSFSDQQDSDDMYIEKISRAPAMADDEYLNPSVFWKGLSHGDFIVWLIYIWASPTHIYDQSVQHLMGRCLGLSSKKSPVGPTHGQALEPLCHVYSIVSPQYLLQSSSHAILSVIGRKYKGMRTLSF